MKKDMFDGVMLNAYPDSLGHNLANAVDILKRDEFRNLFSLFYILPSLFESDLDRGFSVKSYNLDAKMASEKELQALKDLGIGLKLDFVLNHLSLQSPQFRDLLEKGDKSPYVDFFIDWNRFWQGCGEPDNEGCLVPRKEYLDRLFMRKPGLPVLKLPFPDGSDRFYWNTFYQNVNEGPDGPQYWGQMDLDARIPAVWDFYEETLKKFRSYGASLIRLDAFAYLHKEKGQTNFFNEPGTWDYLERIRKMADKEDLMLLPEIHSTYGEKLHRRLADRGYYFYDFFFPGLIIYTLEERDCSSLAGWIEEIRDEGYQTVNMLGCHDGIPLLDMKGLIEEEKIEKLIETIQQRGGRVKNLFGPDGKKISYYQVNATFYGALGVNEDKMLLARAVQLFMPGIPQIWYLDLFGGVNNIEKADREGHKEINRTDLTEVDVEAALKTGLVLKQIKLIRFRNTFPAFGEGAVLTLEKAAAGRLNMTWKKQDSTARLEANFEQLSFQILYGENEEELQNLYL